MLDSLKHIGLVVCTLESRTAAFKTFPPQKKVSQRGEEAIVQCSKYCKYM